MESSYSLRVEKITHLTKDTVQISFRVPDELQKAFQFDPGQYITLEKELNGEHIRRAYSICTSPKDKELSIAAKRIPNGVFSTYLKEELKEGDMIEVFPPDGRFVLLPDIWNYENLGLFAAGSGITPVMSILKSALKETSLKVLLVYGNKTEADTIFLEELKELQQQYPDRFAIQWVFSQEQPHSEALFGRIDGAVLNFALKNKYKSWYLQRFYLCGPQEMVDTLSEKLKENQIDPLNIHTELFMVKSDDEKSIPEGNLRLKLILDREEFEFSTEKDKSILQIAIENGLDAPYSCQGGVCSSCMAKVEEGEVKMLKNQVLTDKELEEGLVLTCQSYALTDEVTIDYDGI